MSFTEIKFIYSQAFSMKMHDLWNIITGDIPYQCKMCEMGVTNKSTLKTHKKKHMVDKPYVCPDCEKYFSNCHPGRAQEDSHASEAITLCSVLRGVHLKQQYEETHKESRRQEEPRPPRL